MKRKIRNILLKGSCSATTMAYCGSCKLPIAKGWFQTSCSCKQCYYDTCSSAGKKHCSICRMLTCSKHGSITSKGIFKCKNCTKEISALEEAGDQIRLKQLLQEENINKGTRINNWNVLNILINGETNIKINIKITTKYTQQIQKSQNKRKIIQEMFNAITTYISNIIDKNKKLYNLYEIDVNNKISLVKGALHLYFPLRVESVSFSTFDIELPMLTDLKISKEQIELFSKSNRIKIDNNNLQTLIRTLKVVKNFYSICSSLMFPINWITNEKALQESKKWNTAILILEKLETIRSMHETKIGEEIQKLVRNVIEMSKTGEIYIPVTWNQKYSPPKEDKNNDNTQNDLDDKNHDGKKNKDFESYQAILWVILKPNLQENDKINISFINTSYSLCDLFPDCTQAHVPKQNRKYREAAPFNNENDDDQFSFFKKQKNENEEEEGNENNNSGENQSEIDYLSVCGIYAGLKPGSIGKANKIDYVHLPFSCLDIVLTGLFLMQLLPIQRELLFGNQSLTNKLSNLNNNENTTNQTTKDGEEDDLSNNLIEMAKNMGKQSSNPIGNMIGSAMRSRLETSAIIPFEEDICKILLDGRTFDGKLIEGHAFYILENIFTTLNELHHENLFLIDEKSIFPLKPGMSIFECFNLFEKFTSSSKKTYLRIMILRSIFLLRNSSTNCNYQILLDFSQRTFFRAMSNPNIFGGKDSQIIRELESLKLLLDNILKSKNVKLLSLKSQSSLSNISTTSPSISNLNTYLSEFEFIISPLISCCKTNSNLLPKIEEINIFSPFISPEKLKLQWFQFEYDKFSNIWNLWIKNASEMLICKDYSNVRRILKVMMDSIPDNWNLFEIYLENNKNHQDNNNQLWINHWCLILLRLIQFYMVLIYHRLGTNIIKHNELFKFGLKPEEYFYFIKFIVLIDQLYISKYNKEIYDYKFHLLSMDFKFLFKSIQYDHYLKFFTANENLLFTEYLQYLNQRNINANSSEKIISSTPQVWSYDRSNENENQNVNRNVIYDDDDDYDPDQRRNDDEDVLYNEDFKSIGDETFLENLIPFNIDILNEIVSRAQAFYGGEIPDVDQFGNRHFFGYIAKAWPREKQSFIFNITQKLKISETHYFNLRFPNLKRSPKFGFIGKIMDDDNFQIENDEPWNHVLHQSKEEQKKLQTNRLKAHNWLNDTYNKLFIIYRKIIEQWLQSHVSDIKLNLVENHLKNLLKQLKFTQNISLKSQNISNSNSKRIHSRDKIILHLSSKEGNCIFYCKKIITQVLTQFNLFKNFLNQFALILTFWCSIFAIKSWESNILIEEENIKFSSLENGIICKIKRFGKEISIMVDCLLEIIKNKNIQLSENHINQIEILIFNLNDWYHGENAKFKSNDEINKLIHHFIGKKQDDGSRLCNYNDTVITFQSCDDFVKLSIHSMKENFFNWQKYQLYVDNAKMEFNNRKQSLQRQMVLTSESLKVFWPSSLLSLYSVTNLIHFIFNCRGSLFFSSISSAISAGFGAIGGALKSGIKTGKFPSERQLYNRFMYSIMKKYCDYLLNSDLPLLEFTSMNMVSILSIITRKFAGSFGITWLPGIRLNSKVILPLYPDVGKKTIPSSSHYVHGVLLPKTIRDQLVRGGICNSLSNGISNIQLLAESTPILNCLDGEIDLCQEMRFDNLSTKWEIPKKLKKDNLLNNWDFENNQFPSFNINHSNHDNNDHNDEDDDDDDDELLHLSSSDIHQNHQNVPVLFQRLRKLRKNSNDDDYVHWKRKVAFGGPTIIHILLGELSLDRISYLLSEKTLQRVFETKLFHPTLLTSLCYSKPKFFQCIIKIFSKSIQTQKNIQNISGELYLRYILFRISNEIQNHIENYEYLSFFYNEIQKNHEISFSFRIDQLFNQLMSPFLHLQDMDNQNHDLLIELDTSKQIHFYSIHKYYLTWIKIIYGYDIDINDPIVSNLITSFTCFKSASLGLKNDEIDLHEIQIIEDWMFNLFQLWKNHLIDPETKKLNHTKISEILYTTVIYFLHKENSNLIKSLKNCTWKCKNYPIFYAQLQNVVDDNLSKEEPATSDINNKNLTVSTNQQSNKNNNNKIIITIEPAFGFLFLNGKMRSFVRYEHVLHSNYQQFFGMKILPCSFFKKNQWDIYECKLKNNKTCKYDYYIIQANRSELYIFRKIQISKKESQWFQYQPNGLQFHCKIKKEDEKTIKKEEEGFPGFLKGSEAWIHYSPGYIYSKGMIFFSKPETNPENSIIHHSSLFYNQNNKELQKITLYDIKRYPSGESIEIIKKKQISKILKSFEDPIYIEFTEKKLYFTRYNLSFTKNQNNNSWYSNDFHGYELIENENLLLLNSNIDPFLDQSCFWLILEKKNNFGVSQYLFIASIKPLLPYSPHLGPGYGMKNYRHSNRSVWIDHQIEKSNEIFSYFTLINHSEYQNLLVTSSSIGQCWLAFLYFIKCDYNNTYKMINNINFETNLTNDQINQLYNILKWPDNSYNGCTIKLKIIAALAKNDPNLFCNAKSDEDNKNSSTTSNPLLKNPLNNNKKQIGRYSNSLLGLTKEEFFDFYILASKYYLKNNYNDQKNKNIENELPAGTIINLSISEWSYINRALNRWPTGMILRSIGSIGLEQTKVLQKNLKLKQPFQKIAQVYDTLLGNNESSEISESITIQDVCFNILEQIRSYYIDQNLIKLALPIFIGTPGKNWSKYFISIYKRLISLNINQINDLNELNKWKFLLSSQPYSGDRCSKLCKILLYKLCFAIENKEISLLPLPKKLKAIRTRVIKSFIGVNTFGISKSRDKIYLKNLETVLQFLDSSISISELNGAGRRKHENFLQIFNELDTLSTISDTNNTNTDDTDDTDSEISEIDWQLMPNHDSTIDLLSSRKEIELLSSEQNDNYSKEVNKSIHSYLNSITKSNPINPIKNYKKSIITENNLKITSNQDDLNTNNLLDDFLNDSTYINTNQNENQTNHDENDENDDYNDELSILSGLLETDFIKSILPNDIDEFIDSDGEINDEKLNDLSNQFNFENPENLILNPENIMNSNNNITEILDNIQQFHQNKEIFELENILEKKMKKYNNRSSNNHNHDDDEFYDTLVTSMSSITNLLKYLRIKKTEKNSEIWNERSNLLFNENYYDQKHHKSSALLMKIGFDSACKIEELDIDFLLPIENTIHELKKELYTIRAHLEKEEKKLSDILYKNILRKPGLVKGSSICSDQAVPLSIVLNLWENDQLYLLHECYGYDYFSDDISNQFHLIIEDIDIKICWRYHIRNIINKINEYESCHHILEKKAILECIYHLLNEKLCYSKQNSIEKVQNRKILSISRMNGFLVRKKQVDIVNCLMKNPNQAIQAALGLGKSSVIVPLTTSALASNGTHCIWIMCPLTDKPETISRCENISKILNHPLLLFHFENDGTSSSLDENNNNSMDNFEFQDTQDEINNQNHKKNQNSRSSSCLNPPYRLDNENYLRELYYDLLRITIEKGLVITTRESLLYFVDTYEQIWLSRNRNEQLENKEGIEKCDKLLYWFSKFFPFFKKYCKAILDEVDEILKANVKVNIALSDMAKINRDTLLLAVECVKILLDPNIFIKIQSNDDKLCFDKYSITSVINLMNNCQAATPIHIKHLIRIKLAKEIGKKQFLFHKKHKYYSHYLSFVLCNNLNKNEIEIFYSKFIKGNFTSNDKENSIEFQLFKKNYFHACNIVRLRELLSGSFATLFKRHNYSLGRMFNNDNKDDVGPYSAVNQPLKNSHLSSEYDWAWALAVNYAMQGITLSQFQRYVNQIRIEAITSINKPNQMNKNENSNSFHSFIDLNELNSRIYSKKQQNHIESSSNNELIKKRVEEFTKLFGISVLKVTKHKLPELLKIINDIGDYENFEYIKVIKCISYLQQARNTSIKEKIKKFYPLLNIDNENDISPHCINDLSFKLFSSSIAKKNWPELIDGILNHPIIGYEQEQKSIEKFKKGIQSRLDFLLNFVNLTYFPSFIEGNATTIVHLFNSTCGFSGTMEVPYSLPQKILSTSNFNLLRDRSIDGIILSRFLKYSLGDQSNDQLDLIDTTKYVDDAVKEILLHRLPDLKKAFGIQSFINNKTREILLSCFNAQAIVDGGALLDVSNDEIISCLLDHDILEILNDPNKPKIKTIRWKEHGEWMTIDIHHPSIKLIQHHRIEPLQLSSTLTFYDQQHSRGTDAKLAPDALMVNTIGDETRLTEWSQAEGRARQSGKGQTSKSIIAPHIRFQQYGDGPLSIQILRTLIRRSSNSEVSDAFYAQAEQLRGYLRDYFRSALSDYIIKSSKSKKTQNEKKFISEITEKLFIHKCDADLTNLSVLYESAKPQEYTSSLNCLQIIKNQEISHFNYWIDLIQLKWKENLLSKIAKTSLLLHLNEGKQALINHKLPPIESLPAGDIGIPRPGEQSFGIVLNTEIASEQMIEVETEMELESESSLARNNDDLQSLRPPYLNWENSWFFSPLQLWSLLFSSTVVIPLNNYFPFYKFIHVTKNLGIWENRAPPPMEDSDLKNLDIFDESTFHWLHDTYIDPFVYHVILQHPKLGFRSVTLSHEEYSEYIFPLLSKTSPLHKRRKQPKISVFRFEGWGWIEFDSTRNSDFNPLPIDKFSPYCKRILAECSLLSGNVELGDIHDQLNFLQLFLSNPDDNERSTIDVILNIMNNQFKLYFKEPVISMLENLTKILTFFENTNKNLLLSSFIASFNDWDKDIKVFIENFPPNGTILNFLNVVTNEISEIIGNELIIHIYSIKKYCDVNWKNLLVQLFCNSTSFQKLKFAKNQIKVISARHRPGITKKLTTAPAWCIINCLLVLENELENK